MRSKHHIINFRSCTHTHKAKHRLFICRVKKTRPPPPSSSSTGIAASAHSHQCRPAMAQLLVFLPWKSCCHVIVIEILLLKFDFKIKPLLAHNDGALFLFYSILSPHTFTGFLLLTPHARTTVCWCFFFPLLGYLPAFACWSLEQPENATML